jgi:hypothetical protein
MKKKSPQPGARAAAIEEGKCAIDPLLIAKALADSSSNSHNIEGGFFGIEFSGGKLRKRLTLYRSIDYRPSDNLSIH